MAYPCKLNHHKECDGCSYCELENGVMDCPECGSTKCDYIYLKNGEIIGCDRCIIREDVYEYERT